MVYKRLKSSLPADSASKTLNDPLEHNRIRYYFKSALNREGDAENSDAAKIVVNQG
jgi:hypothetical protein